jgi:RNA polymerase sigma-70 factor, ECF subfamily
MWRIAASVARGPEVEDLAQEAIIRAYCALKSYRGNAPFGAWLCRIALNAAHDHLRSAWKRRVILTDTLPAGGATELESPEGAAERRELQRRVRQAVANLPEKQRIPIWLHYFEGYPLAEVARLDRTPEATVRSRLRAGMERLSRSLIDLDSPAMTESSDSPQTGGAPAHSTIGRHPAESCPHLVPNGEGCL